MPAATISPVRWVTFAIQGVRLLVEAKKRKGPGGSAVIFKYTIVPQNVHEMTDGVGLAEGLGCDGIAYGYSPEVPEFLATNPNLTARLRTRFSSLLSEQRTMSIEQKRLRHLGLRPGSEPVAPRFPPRNELLSRLAPFIRPASR